MIVSWLDQILLNSVLFFQNAGIYSTLYDTDYKRISIYFVESCCHDSRHTHATMLAEKNVPPKYLQQRLGRKDLQVTMKYYLHLTERMNDEGAAIINSLYQDDTGHKK